MEIKLTILSDDKEYFSRKVSLPCTIGRGRQCGVAILHPVVSRQHCEIYEKDGAVYVRDLGSLNGTIFRGTRVDRGVRVPYGAEFSIGRLFFKIDSAEDPPVGEETPYGESSAFARSSDEFREDFDRVVDNTLDRVFSSEKPERRGPDDDEDPFGAPSGDDPIRENEPFSLTDLAPEEEDYDRSDF